MSGKRIVRRSAEELRKGDTDWARVDALTDDEIEAAVRDDPDAAPLDLDWSQAEVVVPPRKKAVSVRLDEDVLNFFKAQGPGYQTRINAVLRSFMRHSQASGRKKA